MYLKTKSKSIIAWVESRYDKNLGRQQVSDNSPYQIIRKLNCREHNVLART